VEGGKIFARGLFEQAPDASKNAAAALTMSNSREVEYGAALAFVLSGDSSRAQTLADDLERRFPEDTVVRFNYLPVLRARIALNRGDATTETKWLAFRSTETGRLPSSGGTT
jgi:hypothetical protein